MIDAETGFECAAVKVHHFTMEDMSMLNLTEVRAYAARHHIDESAARIFVAGKELDRLARRYAADHNISYSEAFSRIVFDDENRDLVVEYGRAA